MLLYQVVKCRNSKGLNLEEQMQNVFDQHTEIEQDGIVSGGNGKLFCLRDGELGKTIVQKLVKAPCRKIIEELRALFRDFHAFDKVVPNVSEDSDSDGLSFDKGEREQDLRVQKVTQVQEATKKLSSSEWILKMIGWYLSPKWDVDDDGSLYKTMLRPDSAASRDRRKREAEGRNDKNMTDHKRRRGLLPPSSTEPSRNSLWSQGTYSHLHAPSGTLLGSSSHSAMGVSTRSGSCDSIPAVAKSRPHVDDN